MSFAYHSSGEIDENGVYEKPSKWDDKFNELFMETFGRSQTETKELKIIDIPKEFMFEYYDEKISKYDKSSPEYWEWVKLKLYAMSVYKLLEQISLIYLKEFNLEEGNFEKFINFSTKPVRLEDVVKQLETAENSLIQQFSKYNKNLFTKFKKHATLERVRNYAAKAWLMLYGLTRKVPIKSMRKFADVFSGYNLSKDEDILKAYRGYVLLRRNINLYVKPNMLSYVYQGVDVCYVFDNICEEVGAFNRDDLLNIKQRINEDLIRLKTNQKYSLLLDFYYNYDDIQKTFYDVNKTAKDFYEGYGHKTINIFWDMLNDGEDIFMKAKHYLKIIKDLLKQNFKDVFDMDLKALEKIGEQAIDYAINAYNLSHNENLGN